jgi:hypothetical protein
MGGTNSARVTATTHTPKTASTTAPSPFIAISLTPYSVGRKERQFFRPVIATRFSLRS